MSEIKIKPLFGEPFILSTYIVAIHGYKDILNELRCKCYVNTDTDIILNNKVKLNASFTIDGKTSNLEFIKSANRDVFFLYIDKQYQGSLDFDNLLNVLEIYTFTSKDYFNTREKLKSYFE